MPLSRGRLTLRRMFPALLLILASGPVAAADPDDATIQRLDRDIQVLKDEALLFNRDAQLAEEELTYPAHSRVDVYVSVETAALLMQKITISVDGRDKVVYDYSETDALALLRSKGMQRLVRYNVGKGSHRLRASYVAQYADAKPEEQPITGEAELVFDKSLAALSLELVVGKTKRGAKPTLRLKEWRPAK